MRRTYLVLLIWRKAALKKHEGEAHSTSASMKGACESAPVGGYAGETLLFFYTSTWRRKWKILLLSWSSSQNWTFSPNVKWSTRLDNMGITKPPILWWFSCFVFQCVSHSFLKISRPNCFLCSQEWVQHNRFRWLEKSSLLLIAV